VTPRFCIPRGGRAEKKPASPVQKSWEGRIEALTINTDQRPDFHFGSETDLKTGEKWGL